MGGTVQPEPVPEQVPVVVVEPYDPDHSLQPYSPQEVDRALATAAPTPTPAPGDAVLYRHTNHGDLTDALVLQVVDDTPPTSPVSRPWPTLVLDTAHGRVATRQALVRGSAGWLPAGWTG